MKSLVVYIEELVNEKFEGTDCFLVDIAWNKMTTKIEVFVDSDRGISIGECAQLSRYLEKHLEEKKLVGEKYTLEVSSPGIDRPLKLRRQYNKAVNRPVIVQLTDGTKKEGLLLSVDEAFITIQEQLSKKDIKKRKKEKLPIHIALDIPFEDIKQTMEKIVF